MENQRILTAGFIGGLVAGTLNSVPFLNFINCFCCLGIMLGGAIALVYYDRTFFPREYITPASAVTLGITAGLFGAFISLFIEGVIYLNFGHWELEFMQQMLDNMDEVPTFMYDMMSDLEGELSGGFMLGSILLRNLLIMPVFCLAGSLVTRVFINKNRA